MAGKFPLQFLRTEGLVVFAAATAIYWQQDFGWLLFGLLLFTPDLFMIGYLRDTRLGAWTYNVGHSYVLPVLLSAYYLLALSAPSLLLQLSLIWLAHIGLDRVLGYGLKHTDDFKHTHLGWIG